MLRRGLNDEKEPAVPKRRGTAFSEGKDTEAEAGLTCLRDRKDGNWWAVSWWGELV